MPVTTVDSSRALIISTIEKLSPYLMSIDSYVPDVKPAATSASDDAATKMDADLKSTGQFFRPSGEEYLARSIMVSGVKTTDVAMVRAAAKTENSVLLYGPPGTGKTALIEAALTNVVTVQGTIETETADFVGSWVQEPDGTYRWVDGPLVVAADEGRPLFIDEIALIDPRSLAVVYGAMDGRDEIVVTQNPKRGAVKVQPGFIVMGAFNPNVPGAILSDALISRFPIQVEVTTDWELARKMGVPAKMIQIVRNLNTKAESGEVTSAPQLRELLAYKRLEKNFGAEFALKNFFGQIRPENRDVAKQVIENVLGVVPNALSI